MSLLPNNLLTPAPAPAATLQVTGLLTLGSAAPQAGLFGSILSFLDAGEAAGLALPSQTQAEVSEVNLETMRIEGSPEFSGPHDNALLTQDAAALPLDSRVAAIDTASHAPPAVLASNPMASLAAQILIAVREENAADQATGTKEEIQDIPTAPCSAQLPPPAAAYPSVGSAPKIIEDAGVGQIEGRQTTNAATESGAVVLDTRSIAAMPHQATLQSPVEKPVADLATSRIADAPNTLDLGAGDQWIEQLAKDIALFSGKADRVRFRLSPENLGQLDVDIGVIQDSVDVKIMARSAEAAAHIHTAQPRLSEEMRSQGLTLSDSHIAQDQRSSSSQQQAGSQHKASPAMREADPAGDNLDNVETKPKGRFA